jgi:hypothetical protein
MRSASLLPSISLCLTLIGFIVPCAVPCSGPEGTCRQALPYAGSGDSHGGRP